MYQMFMNTINQALPRRFPNNKECLGAGTLLVELIAHTGEVDTKRCEESPK
jgi:hypothetical protein